MSASRCWVLQVPQKILQPSLGGVQPDPGGNWAPPEASGLVPAWPCVLQWVRPLWSSFADWDFSCFPWD
jgi:hypothetical protein